MSLRRTALILALLLVAPTFGPPARAEIYVAKAGAVTDMGATAPRQELGIISDGSVGSSGVSSAITDPGMLKSASHFENPIACVCTPQGEASAQSEIHANDLVITGPPGDVAGVLHLQLEGHIGAGGTYPWSPGVEIQIHPEGNLQTGSYYISTSGVVTATGLLTPIAGSTVNLPLDVSFNLATGTPHTMDLVLYTFAGGMSVSTTANFADSRFMDDVDGDGYGGLHFVSGAGAVTLPPGYTLDSPQLGIAGGSWGTATTGVTPDRRTGAGLALALHPNPTSGPSTLRYVLPRSGRARVEVFSPDGRRLAVEEDAWRPAGPHQITLRLEDGSGRALPPGLYLARLEFEGESRVARIAVVGRPH
jgi:hypothetical protein